MGNRMSNLYIPGSALLSVVTQAALRPGPDPEPMDVNRNLSTGLGIRPLAQGSFLEALLTWAGSLGSA